MTTTTKRDGKRTPVFNHLTISVKDLQKVTAFYRDVMLLEQIEEPFKVGRHSWFSLGPGISLHLVAGAKKVEEHLRGNHFCVSVTSMDAFIDHLDQMDVPYFNSKGKPQVTQTRPDGIRQLYVVDPEGHWIEVNDEVGNN